MVDKVDHTLSVPLKSTSDNGHGDKDEEKVYDIKHASDIYGDWGPYQRNCLIYMISIYLVASFQNIGITFYSAPIGYHCKLPPGAEGRNTSKCFTYEGSSEPCREWTYDHSFYKSTIVDEFDLVCDREHFVSMSKSVYQVGYLIASLLSGWMSDKYGRLFTFKCAVILEIFASLSQALSTTIYYFLTSRLFLGIGAFTRFVTAVTLLIELVGPKSRGKVKFMSEIGWCGGLLLLPIANYYVPHFRHMQLIVFGYEVILSIGMWKLRESPRWLITHNRIQEATELIRAAAKVNGVPTDEIESKIIRFKR